MKDRALARVQGKNPLTEETLKQLKLDKSEVNKLMLQDASPHKYSTGGAGILGPLTENLYRQ